MNATTKATETDPNECALATDFGMQMAQKYCLKHGRSLPADDIEFAGMLAIAFMLGRESLVGRARP